MLYIKVRWIHSHANEPVLIYAELDRHRFESRKVEIFHDGHCSYADRAGASHGAMLGLEAVPSLEEIGKDPQFVPAEIPDHEFESIWRGRQGNLRHLVT